MILLKNMEKKYDKGKANEVIALSDIHLQIKQGEMIAITGSSGSGKSTLLHMIGCIDVPDQGEYQLFGELVQQKKDKELARLRNHVFGFVLQNYGLIEYRTVYDNLIVPTLFHKEIKAFKIKKRCKEVLKQMGMESFLYRRVSELSGGEKQRIAVCRALMNSPDIILADEPTGALDSKNSIMLMEEFKKLNELGKTIIMVTHNNQLLNYFDRSIVLEDGRIINQK